MTRKPAAKKVRFGSPPGAGAPAARVEEWVARRAEPAAEPPPPPPEPTKRLTIDIPVGLHTRLKVGCARAGRAIADEVRDLLERRFPPE